MAVTRSQKIRLGVFVGSGLICLLGGLAVLAGLKLGERRDAYVVRFADASASLSGLEVGAPVKYGGVRVGRVDTIRVAPTDVSVLEVAISLDGGTPVAEDSVASAASLGITGLKYIELSRGSRKARIRKPGEEIPAGPSLFDALTDRATVITAKLEALIDNLQGFTDARMRGRVAEVLEHTDTLLVTAEATVAENRENLKHLSQRIADTSNEVQSLTRELRGTTARVNAMLDQSSPQVRELLAQTNALASDLRRSREQLDGVLAESREALKTARATLGDEGLGRTLTNTNRVMERGYLVLAQSQEEIDATLTNLKETAENLSRFSEKIRENPSLLLRGGGERGREESER